MFNRFFIKIVPNLKISMENDFDTNFLETKDPVLNAISKWRNHRNKRKKQIEWEILFP